LTSFAEHDLILKITKISKIWQDLNTKILHKVSVKSQKDTIFSLLKLYFKLSNLSRSCEN